MRFQLFLKVVTLVFIIGNLNAQVLVHERPPAQFIPNNGQWPSRVQAHLQTENARIWILDDGLRFALRGPGKNDSNDLFVFTERFYGASKGKWSSIDSTGSLFNYFISGQEEVVNVKGFKKGRMDNLYPGVSLEFEVSIDGELKTSWICQKPGQLNIIESRFEGVNDIRSKSNHLYIDLPVGELRLDCPFGKTDKGTSKVDWRGKGKSWTPYSKGSIMIDPVYRFSTFSGSVSDNFGYTATYDNNGRTWAGGIVFGGQFPYYNGIQSSFSGGATDVALMLFSSDGTGLLSGTFFGGNNREQPHSMMVSPNGDLFVLGVSGSTNLATSLNAYDSSFNGGSNTYAGGQTFSSGTDIFILRLDSTGSIKKSLTYLGGAGNDGVNEYGTLNYGDEARGEILTTSNAIYVATSTGSMDFPNTNGSGLGGLQDGVLFKMSHDLDSLIWSSHYGGSNVDGFFGLVHLNNQNINHLFAVGMTTSDSLADISSYQTQRAGAEDAWIVRVNSSSGQLEKSTYFGGLGSDFGFLLAHNESGSYKSVGDSNSVAIVGNNKSSLASLNSAWYQPNSSQYIAWINNELDSIYRIQTFGDSSFISQNLSPTALMLDECGSLYFSGWGGATNTAGSTNGLFCTTDALQKNTDGSDFYFLVLGKNGFPLYASYFGGNNSDEHVDGGTSRFDPNGVIHQAICAGCGGNSNLPVFPHNAYSTINGSSNCNMMAVQIAFEMQKVDLDLFLNRDTICTGSIAEIVGQVSRCDSSFIDWGDGQTSSVMNPIGQNHQYNQAGLYVISIYSTDKICDTYDFQSLIIYVAVPSPPGVNMEVVYDYCDTTLSVILIPSDSTRGNNFCVFWGDGDTSCHLSNISISHNYYRLYGPIEVIVIAFDTICGLSDTVLYVVNYRHPIGEIETKITVNPCGLTPIVFAQGLADNGTHIYWYPSGFSFPALTGEEVMWQLPGSGQYSVDIIIWDSICSRWDTSFVDYFSVNVATDSVLFPNVFTPNNDGFNDFFKILNSNIAAITNLDLQVYNRWGQKVFVTNDPQFIWDGKYNQNSLSSGVYFWIAKWTNLCGYSAQSHGDVMINTP